MPEEPGGGPGGDYSQLLEMKSGMWPACGRDEAGKCRSGVFAPRLDIEAEAFVRPAEGGFGLSG